MTGMDARKLLVHCSFCFVLALIGGDDVHECEKYTKNHDYICKRKKEKQEKNVRRKWKNIFAIVNVIFDCKTRFSMAWLTMKKI